MLETTDLRASDADRERAVAVLRREVGTGRLTLDEFSQRAAAAYAARTVSGLADLTRDLPRGVPDSARYLRHARAPVLLTVALLLAVAFLTFTGAPAMAAIGDLTCH